MRERAVRKTPLYSVKWQQRLLSFLIAAFFVGCLFGARHLAHAAAGADVKSGAVSGIAASAAAGDNAKKDDFDFFSDKPVSTDEIVVVPPEKSKWITVGGPIALVLFMGCVLLIVKWAVPFRAHSVDINLRDFPPAAKRGIALAVALFGIAFAFGAAEIWYQMQFFGSTDKFIEQMSLGKLIVMTHAHLFGFTTSFFIIGIPFSMQFNHLKSYQWVFPVGLAASLTDVMSWWGIKYFAPTFEYVSFLCGILFSTTYLWMLVGLLRVLLFDEIIWKSDKDRYEQIALVKERRKNELIRQRQRNEAFEVADLGLDDSVLKPKSKNPGGRKPNPGRKKNS